MKKIFSFLLATTMLSLSILTACGNSKPETSSSNTTVAGTTRDATMAAASSGAVSGTQKYAGKTLTVLYMSSVYADAARAMVPEFEQKTGAKVEVVDFPYSTLHEKALLDLTSGAAAAYDVIDVASQWDGEFAPFMTDLAPYIQKDNYDMSVWIDNVLNNCGKWQDTIIGIPNANTPQIFAYRKDLLPNGIPKTWDEYREAIKKAQSSGVYGATIAEAPGQLGGVFDYVLWSMGGAWAAKTGRLQ